MITTVTLNPCIDKTLVIEKMNIGGLNKVISTREDLGGKGINVSTALNNFGKETLVIGLDFSKNDFMVKNTLEEKNIPHNLININGKLRVNTKVFETENNEMTEFNEKGSLIKENEMKKVLNVIKKVSEKTEILVLSGSTCPGFKNNIYAEIIKAAKSVNNNLKIILDTEGEKFLQGIKQKPTIIKPNIHELESSFNVVLKNHNDIIEISKNIISGGIEIVCVSLGGDGAIIVSKEEAFFAKPLSLDVKSVQGAGDSLVAGLCYGLKNNSSTKELLRYGVAAAGSTIILEGTQMGNYKDFVCMSEQVSIEKI